jgi:hypothetical protein
MDNGRLMVTPVYNAVTGEVGGSTQVSGNEFLGKTANLIVASWRM